MAGRLLPHLLRLTPGSRVCSHRALNKTNGDRLVFILVIYSYAIGYEYVVLNSGKPFE